MIKINNILVVAAGIIAGLAVYWWKNAFRHVIIRDQNVGMLFHDGVFLRQLGPGRYRLHRTRDQVEVIDLRPHDEYVVGQELLTKDQLSIKLSVVLRHQVVDPALRIKAHDLPLHAIHTAVQAALRSLTASLTLDELLADRPGIEARLAELVQGDLAKLGSQVQTVILRDIMLPNALKRAFAGVVEAQKEAQRRLEVARGEQALLRSMANTARMLQDQPALMQARVLQALEQGRNTIVFGGPDMLGKPAVAEPAPKRGK